MLFADRRDAGEKLAKSLEEYRDTEALVLALPRGGVPVAAEVARELNLDLDVFVVRKLGLPVHPELAMGAIASGGVMVLNQDVVRGYNVGEDDLEQVAQKEGLELERREEAYRRGREMESLSGRTVIVVDDGLATGATMRAALAALKRLEPSRVVAAVPVAAREVCAMLEDECDEMVCLETPEPFSAVGTWYQTFGQTPDEEVTRILDGFK